jgi:hypothetical protein
MAFFYGCNTLNLEEGEERRGLKFMKHYYIILNILLNSSLCQSQSENTIFKASQGKWNFPISNVQSIDTMTFDCYGIPANSKCLILKSQSSTQVRAIQGGHVQSVFEQAGIYTIIIKTGDYFLIYDGLSKPFLKKGDMITEGKSIGNLACDDMKETYDLNLSLMKGTKDLNINRWFKWQTAHNIGIQ